MVSSIVWAVVALIFILLVNYRYGQWQKNQKPLGEKQYNDAIQYAESKHNELSDRIKDLQNQLSKLSIQKGFSDE